jgi:hypothetical protein
MAPAAAFRTTGSTPGVRNLKSDAKPPTSQSLLAATMTAGQCRAIMCTTYRAWAMKRGSGMLRRSCRCHSDLLGYCCNFLLRISASSVQLATCNKYIIKNHTRPSWMPVSQYLSPDRIQCDVIQYITSTSHGRHVQGGWNRTSGIAERQQIARDRISGERMVG